ncbi:MAG: prepilin-type N-terminal cleavage/methylation domain-containing protein [Phycisphaerales bacterium]|nr:prepilin-type N-terminal cleavage/methylation domain-containing protein [Phycisphaerae bacterium]NNF42843.1 prepilin-type N-terminal cleavage/methylation domain-containing protein [Phycisphaerales bacterium]NNM24961.1 prepilin-type N-terminal cleavage/methylation domain-containing protein [Phycisphaerales bacterium]
MPRTLPTDIPPAASRGFTLIEVTLSLLIVGVVLVSSLYALGAVARLGRTVVDDDRARLLARSLLAEVIQSPYEDPDGSPVFGREFESGSTRDGWDDVDDYHGWSASPPQAKDGTPLSGFTDWTRQVSVAYASTGALATAVAETGLKRITVTVTDPSGVVTTVEALRSRASSYEQAPALDTQILTFVGIEVTPTASGVMTTAGTNLRNPVTVGAVAQ